MRRAIPYTTQITGDTDTHSAYGVGPATDYGLPFGAEIPSPISGTAYPYWSNTGGYSIEVRQGDWAFHAQHHNAPCRAGFVTEGTILGSIGRTGSAWEGYHSHQFFIAAGVRLSAEEFYAGNGFIGGGYKQFVQPFLTSASGNVEDIVTEALINRVIDAVRRDARYRLYQCTEHPGEYMGVNWHMDSSDPNRVMFPVGPDQIRRLYMPYQIMGDLPEQARQVTHHELRNTFKLANGTDGIYTRPVWVDTLK